MTAQRLLIVLMNTDPRNVEELGAPFYYAAVAAAMDHQVDVLCTAIAGTAAFTRTSTEAASQVWMPPMLKPIIPIRAGSISFRVSR